MKVASLEAIFRALQDAEARYLVVGGVAVIAHGYVRTTEDLDLVLDLSTESLIQTLKVLESLGYRPIIPVSIHDFANASLRHSWIENRNMKVFGLVSDAFPDVTIDIFPREPFAFAAEYAAAVLKNITPTVMALVVSVPTLLALKTDANRLRDRNDIEQLRKLHPER